MLISGGWRPSEVRNTCLRLLWPETGPHTVLSQLLYMGCLFTRERKQKNNPIFIFKSVRVRLRESVRLRECVNTEFDWELKRGFEKASVSRAVRLRECPLAES